MCCAEQAFFHCWCSLDKKGLFFFDEDNNDSVDDHDNAEQKENEEFVSCFVWTKPQKKLWNKADEVYTTRKNIVVWTVCKIDVFFS